MRNRTSRLLSCLRRAFRSGRDRGRCTGTATSPLISRPELPRSSATRRPLPSTDPVRWDDRVLVRPYLVAYEQRLWAEQFGTGPHGVAA